MISSRFDIKRMNTLKDILLRLNNGEAPESVRMDVENFFKDANVSDILLTEHHLINSEDEITAETVKKLSSIHPHLYSISLNEKEISETSHPGHPVQTFKDENIGFLSILNQITFLFETYEKNPHRFEKTGMIDVVKQQLLKMGEFYKHFHRKEKLFFPVMERYGYFDPTRIMWKGDDRIRALYQAVKRQTDKLPNINVQLVRKTYATFEKEFTEMIFQEEAIILPVLQSVFHENDWARIANESSAFGYALIEPVTEWPTKLQDEVAIEEDVLPTNQNIPFGGGYLTTEEANHILNNLPLEITFVDKNSVFKYFNKITEASDMLLVRTPISIGRNVANCHPPKSLKKIMTLIRDLKTRKRTSESMWFKKKDHYIHITYKGLFDEQDEFLGILEYVQDIQPFLDLPSDVKRRLSKVDQ